MKKEDNNNIVGLSALYDGVAQNLSRVHSADDAIETKAAAFLAAGLVIITLVFSTKEELNMCTFLGVVFILVSLILSFYILWSRSYSNTTVNVKKNLDYLDKPDRELLLHLISDCEDSLNKSEAILNKKVKIYPWMLIFFVIGSVISILFVI